VFITVVYREKRSMVVSLRGGSDVDEYNGLQFGKAWFLASSKEMDIASLVLHN